MKTNEDLADLLHASDDALAKTVIHHAFQTMRAYEIAHQDLQRHLAWLARDLATAVEIMDAGDNPSSLGVLQGNGVAADRMCGELATLKKTAQAAEQRTL